MGTPDRLFGSQEMSVGKGIGRVAERGYRRTLAKLVGVWDVLASLEGLVLFAVAITLTLSLMGAGQIAAVTINPGDILVADNGSSRVIRVDPVSGAQTLVSSGGLFVAPIGLALEASGDILVVDNAAFGTGAVIRVDAVSGAQTLVSSGGFFGSPQGGITLEASGDILVTTPGTSRGVIRINPISGTQTLVSSGGLFANPIGLAIETSGNIVVSDQTALSNGAVIRVIPVGGIQIPVSTDQLFGCPIGLALEATGDILVTTSPACGGAGASIVHVDPVTGFQTVVSSGQFFVGPYGLAIEASGNIVVADANAAAVIRVDAVSGAQTLVSSGGLFVVPAGIAIVPKIGPPTNTDQCKNGGWQRFNFPRRFKNQGDCIQFVNTGK